MSLRGLDIAMRSMAAQQQAIDVLNHNIANANTPGFSRQRIEFVTAPAYLIPSLNQSLAARQAGSGVNVGSINRIRDLFIDAQVRIESRNLAEAQVRQQTFDKLQIIFREPSENGFTSALSKFWGAWHDLSANPGDQATRAAVLQQGLGVAALLNHGYAQLDAERSQVATFAALKAQEANAITAKLADLNVQIQRAQLTGAKPNDLLDRRDLLLDQLSQILQVKVVTNQDESVTLYAGGQALLDGSVARTLGSSLDPTAQLHVTWAENGADLNPGGGQLQAARATVNTLIAGRMSALDGLAIQLRDDVNALHTTGFTITGATGGDFFVGTGARDLAVAAGVKADLRAIAAAGQPGALGDGLVALAIAQLAHGAARVSPGSELKDGTALPLSGASVQRIVVHGANPGTAYQITSSSPGSLTLSATISGATVSQTTTVADLVPSQNQTLDFSSLGVTIVLRSGAAATAASIVADLTDPGRDQILVATRTPVEEGYQQVVVQLGIDARGNDDDVRNQEALLNNLEQQRTSISGVSLDEESANLIKHLRAYQASARLITVMDEMLETLVRGTGITGRF
ncbi:MAG: flagellar hook-associated protein FlgK [Chloroflexi bacterium]|nr:flagellar hook-associated protein FlgK [Chloroflexota bacterium]